jgi:hypothetical protein
MSVIEDTRKLLQDFLAPELRELSARIDTLEARMDGKFQGLDARFDSAERLASERRAQTLPAIGRLAAVYEPRERITRIEARKEPISQSAPLLAVVIRIAPDQSFHPHSCAQNVCSVK